MRRMLSHQGEMLNLKSLLFDLYLLYFIFYFPRLPALRNLNPVTCHVAVVSALLLL